MDKTAVLSFIAQQSTFFFEYVQLAHKHKTGQELSVEIAEKTVDEIKSTGHVPNFIIEYTKYRLRVVNIIGEHPIYMFAYGSNMSHEQMKKRCPDSKYMMSASLRNHKLVFDGFSKGKNSSTANIIECKNSAVWGGLFHISVNDLINLDVCEGFPHVYNRKTIIVTMENGIQAVAHTYHRTGKREAEPTSLYRDVCIKGALDCGLPKLYIARVLCGET